MRHPSAKPSFPHVQFRAAHLKDELDARRLPDESYGATVQWILRQYFDMMATLDNHYGPYARSKDDSWYEEDRLRRAAIAQETVQPLDLRAPTRKLAS